MRYFSFFCFGVFGKTENQGVKWLQDACFAVSLLLHSVLVFL